MSKFGNFMDDLFKRGHEELKDDEAAKKAREANVQPTTPVPVPRPSRKDEEGARFVPGCNPQMLAMFRKLYGDETVDGWIATGAAEAAEKAKKEAEEAEAKAAAAKKAAASTPVSAPVAPTGTPNPPPLPPRATGTGSDTTSTSAQAATGAPNPPPLPPRATTSNPAPAAAPAAPTVTHANPQEGWFANGVYIGSLDEYSVQDVGWMADELFISLDDVHYSTVAVRNIPTIGGMATKIIEGSVNATLAEIVAGGASIEEKDFADGRHTNLYVSISKGRNHFRVLTPKTYSLGLEKIQAISPGIDIDVAEAVAVMYGKVTKIVIDGKAYRP